VSLIFYLFIVAILITRGQPIPSAPTAYYGQPYTSVPTHQTHPDQQLTLQNNWNEYYVYNGGYISQIYPSYSYAPYAPYEEH